MTMEIHANTDAMIIDSARREIPILRATANVSDKTISPFLDGPLLCSQGTCAMVWQQKMVRFEYDYYCKSDKDKNQRLFHIDMPQVDGEGKPLGRYFICSSEPRQGEETCDDAVDPDNEDARKERF